MWTVQPTVSRRLNLPEVKDNVDGRSTFTLNKREEETNSASKAQANNPGMTVSVSSPSRLRGSSRDQLLAQDLQRLWMGSLLAQVLVSQGRRDI